MSHACMKLSSSVSKDFYQGQISIFSIFSRRKYLILASSLSPYLNCLGTRAFMKLFMQQVALFFLDFSASRASAGYCSFRLVIMPSCSLMLRKSCRILSKPSFLMLFTSLSLFMRKSRCVLPLAGLFCLPSEETRGTERLMRLLMLNSTAFSVELGLFPASGSAAGCWCVLPAKEKIGFLSCSKSSLMSILFILAGFFRESSSILRECACEAVRSAGQEGSSCGLAAIFINAVFINNCTDKLQCIIMEQQMHVLLKECNGSEQSIRDVAGQYLKVKESERLTAAKIIENFMDFQQYELHHKMSVLQIMTELLLNDKDKTYLLHLSSRMLYFIRRHKHLILQDPQSTLKLKKAIQRWRSEKIFSMQFMNKVYESAGRALQAALQEETDGVNHFARYSKTMVMSIADVTLLYALKCRANKLDKQTANLHKEQEQIRSGQAQAAQQQNGKQLLKITDKLIQQHTQMLLDLQKGSQELFAFFKAENQAIEAYPMPSDS